MSVICSFICSLLPRILIAFFAALASMALTGTLLAQTTYYSRQTGVWSALTTWSTESHSGAPAAALPTANDDVIVNAGHVITLDLTTTIRNLTITNGIVQYDNVAIRELSINNNLIIAPSGTLTVVNNGMGFDNRCVLRGNVTNDGVWLFRPLPNNNNPRVITRFQGALPQLVRGTGTTRLNRVEMDKGGVNNFVDVGITLGISAVNNFANDAITFAVTPPFGGRWQQSAGTLNFDDGVVFPRSQTVEVSGALRVIGTGTMVLPGGSLILTGGEFLVNTTGAPLAIGTMTGHSLRYDGADKGRIILQNGTVVIAGRLSRSAVTASDISYTQSGGTLIVGAVGHTSGAHGTFDIATANSDFTMTGGTILIRNRNAAAAGSTRPADFNVVPAAVSLSGGVVQFGDEMTAPGTTFDYNVPASALFAAFVVGAQSTVRPRDPDETLRLSGNLLVNGTWNSSQTSTPAPAPQSTVIMQGATSLAQSIGGTGVITMHNLSLSRRGVSTPTDTALALNRSLTLTGVLDMQELGSAPSQMIALGTGTDLIITNSSPSAIVNAAPARHIRTSTTSGRLIRALTGGETYDFPIGSLGSPVKPAATYTPFRCTAESGASGQIGVRVASGLNALPSFLGGHAQLNSIWETFLRRVYSITTPAPAFTGRAQLIFSYPDDLAGSIDVARIGRYRPDESTTAGTWADFGNSFLTTGTSSGTFSTTSLDHTALAGDWTLIEAPTRVFYSRQSGLWRSGATWSFVSHSGRAAMLFPSKPQDSVVIGGGTSGNGNHEVLLDTIVSPRGTALGTSTGNTGTLDITPTAILSGTFFTMSAGSTLGIGSPAGIRALPDTANGSIRTRASRTFSPDGRYKYIGSTNQVFGNGLPLTVRSLQVNKPAPTFSLQTPPAAVLLADTNIVVNEELRITSGILDVRAYRLSAATATSTQSAFLLETGATLRIGGTSAFVNNPSLGLFNGAISGYGRYGIDSTSTVEFNGTDQTIIFAPDSAGYGNLSVRNAGIKLLRTPATVRGNLLIRDDATFVNSRAAGALRVLGNVYNNGTLQNEAVLDIGR
jgi:hypothetical protein